MPTIQIWAIDTNTGTLIEHRFPAESSPCELTMQPLPGTSAIHLLVRVGEAATRAEIALDNEDPVPVNISWSDPGGILVSSGRRRVFTFPADDRYAPPPPLRPAAQTAKLDLLFLIDGTTQFPVIPADGNLHPYLTLLLDPTKDAAIAELCPSKTRAQAWNAHIDSMVQLAEKLRERYPDVRSNVIAFGDESLHFIGSASDLGCLYSIHPETVEQRRLKPLTSAQLKESFLHLPPTSGGDYVDALAGALYLCREAGWRKDARHILVLFGDSPGFSLAYPPPNAVFGIDIHVRGKDVDTEALRLHSDHQVEIISIYAAAPAESQAYGMTRPYPLLEYTAEQYARLASLRSWAWNASTFQPKAVAETVLSPPPLLGRQSAAAILTEPVP